MDAEWLLKISPSPRIAGDAASPGRWVEAMRVIYEHELVLFEDASYEVEVEGVKFPCPAGSFIIVPPARRHITRELSGLPGHRYWIHFDWLHSGPISGRPVMTYCPATPDSSLFRLPPDFVPKGIFNGHIRSLPNALELFHRVEELFNSGSGRERLLSRACLLELLLELLAPDSTEAIGEAPSSRIASKIRETLAGLASLPARENLSIQRTLEESGLSYAHQCRLFKGQYGISPVQYVAELRMTRIKALLRDTALSVSQIADMEGFDNLGYFSRLFRKHAGTSPTAYRQASRK